MMKPKNPPFRPSQKIIFAVLLLSACAAGLLWKIHRDQFVWTAFGESRLDNFGAKVAPAGDVNGDGYADAAVWAPGHGNQTGKVYIYLGSAKGLSKSPAWAVEGEADKDQYGHSFGTLGDINGDGFDDFIVGAQGYNGPHGTDAGK